MQYTIQDFQYDLPESQIAQKPLDKKDESRLFVLDRATGTFRHQHFYDLPDLLRQGDLLVVNDTRVLPSRLITRRHSGGMVKILLLKPHIAGNNSLWEAMVTPIKRLKPGESLDVVVDDSDEVLATIKVYDIILGPDGFKRLLVDLGEPEHVYQLLQRSGFAPLPPYIHRDYNQGVEREADIYQYQTVYATNPGAVAAPTAGLHFTDEVLERLEEKGIEVVRLTLHVGAGTFKPIEDSLESHTIEEETYTISPETAAKINAAKQSGRRVIAVGTTSLRTLETAGATGVLQAADNASTSLYIRPGHEFKMADAMITNFHLSRSSLLVLVAAFAGRDLIMSAYQHAVQEGYRFYSYGDSMLIE
jgi:S-adenosylmethionine:tRNA ribosyltransferase-isomerase